ncbi:ComEC/Rec2 family competence protein [Microbacterium sp. NPDC089189]|uniref:ComEC/Rec2 family competence protein n=1 Tax=Microbacterium sp. NPDC089189 TaxID=3154972 RepID=UPI0034368133
MDPRAWRLVPAALGTGATAIALTIVPSLAAGAAWLLGGAALVCAVLTFGTRASRLLVLAAVALLFATVAAATVAGEQPVRAMTASAADGRALTLEVRVTGKAEPTVRGARVDAVVETLRVGDDALPGGAPVTLLLETVPPQAAPGARWGFIATAFPADAGERAVLVVRPAGDIAVLAAPTGVEAASAWLRERLAAATDGLPQPGAGLVPGLAVGDTAAVDADLDAAMRTSGLTHLTAVSGANCAIVVGLAFLGAAAVGAGRALRVAAGLAALVGFVVLVTPEPSVIRAATMSAVAMLALLLGRRGAGLSVLSLAVALLLALDPWLALSLGFALSVAATGALLVLAPPLARGLARAMPHPLAVMLAVPLSAQLVCGPLIVLVSPGVAVYGVVANLLAAPAAPAATVLGLAACLLAPVPLLQAGLVGLAWIPAAWIAATAHATAALPGSTLPWVEGWGGVVALAAAGAVLVVLLVSTGRGRRSRALRWAAGIASGIGGALAIGTLLVSSVVVPLTTPREWRIALCDVGQGDAVLLRSAGAVMLIDTGPSPEPVAACLARLGIDRIDVLVLTHFDLDHVGGVGAIAGRVGVLLHGPADEDGTRRIRQVSAEQTHQVAAGASGRLGDARWRVVWPAPEDTVAGNDASVVIEVSGGGVPRSILLGDLGAEAQQRLRAGGMVRGPYDVVKFAHHGSADQDPGLYRLIAARLALIPVGEDNDYGHPRADALALLGAGGTQVARSDQDGLILVGLDAGVPTLWRERAPPEGRRRRARPCRPRWIG